MGTRADFYVGRGAGAKWLGSIAYDGYPEGIDPSILKASNESVYRTCVREWFETRDDASGPDHGWPWPWDNSQTTDYSYHLETAHVRERHLRTVTLVVGVVVRYAVPAVAEARHPDLTIIEGVAPAGTNRAGNILISGPPAYPSDDQKGDSA